MRLVGEHVGQGDLGHRPNTAPTATPAATTLSTTCTTLGGVSILPKHPQELIGLPDRSAAATTTANTRYDAATSAAEHRIAGDERADREDHFERRHRRARACAPAGRPSGASACAVSAGSSALNAPPSASRTVAIANGPARTLIADAPYLGSSRTPVTTCTTPLVARRSGRTIGTPPTTTRPSLATCDRERVAESAVTRSTCAISVDVGYAPGDDVVLERAIEPLRIADCNEARSMVANASLSGANTVNGPGPASSALSVCTIRRAASASVVRSAAMPDDDRGWRRLGRVPGEPGSGIGAGLPTSSDASTAFTAGDDLAAARERAEHDVEAERASGLLEELLRRRPAPARCAGGRSG